MSISEKEAVRKMRLALAGPAPAPRSKVHQHVDALGTYFGMVVIEGNPRRVRAVSKALFKVETSMCRA